MEHAITTFRGEYRWLSNFFMRTITVGNMQWASSEHCYQAAKSKRPEDWEAIQNCASPGKAKSAGRHVLIRPDWNQIKLEVMEEILRAKFDQHADLMEKLQSTKGQQLIEGNNWGDTYWGVCNGRGNNNLGKLLMKIRDHYYG
jgi:ribA/ribD-fused uncharacterized protein